MKKTLIFVLLIMSGLVLSSRNYSNRNSNRLYNPETITTVRGSIVQIDNINIRNYPIVRLKLALNEKDFIYIHTSPYFYMEKNKWSFRIGQGLEVIGSKVKYENNDVIIAKTINSEGKTYKFRDDQGNPLWAGQTGKGKGKGQGKGKGRGMGRGNRF